jgi:hypothetical protein
MASDGGDHILLEVADGLHFIGQLAGLQAAGKRDRLIAQSGLGLRQQLGDIGGLLRVEFLSPCCLKVAEMISFSRCEICAGLIALPPPHHRLRRPTAAIAKTRARTGRPG